MKKSNTLFISTIIGLCFLPIILRRKYRRQSLVVFSLSAITNTLVSDCLIKKRYFRFPIRYFPEVFPSNVVYDCLIGPLFATAYCQTTADSNFRGILRQSVVYSSIQAVIEYWVLVKTNLIKYNNKKWSIWHSFIGLILFKVLLVRGAWALVSRVMVVNEKKVN
ncbi:hypothetical protein Amet_4596 [Alkaliphilus metalliredigens QYMF]|uniref:Uncharacterized protein n=1 Tax=Alkaliphilus metalliredigens (strain QYMF) TaxID=293826 RepID=A6TWU9_ALKMQ|nr:CBO0543 family protein [Alkaliphilus metalliredigens]ABR50667.1 hypothetical protein Amet_4596 [Alkaliphilus metalliredigens QYMF]